ncbi:MAG TPA: U32 family peptidase [Polyangium sp.]|nr:U32 family peptidase [Polyangium sp.]
MSSPSVSRRPEILAPAGDETAMRAAIAAGADAVYFGLKDFNARARATNFDADALGKTMTLLHEHGVKGYVTLNTLVFDDELESVERAIRTCAQAGVDAVIVQDFAVAKMVKAIAPDLPIHASTQMTCTDAGAVEMARELGAERVILARELSLDDIENIRRSTDMELEVFVHGALCIAYSGQCLTSEAIGGRSANRGACAQACRLPYELVVDGEVRDIGDRAYLLSPQDLEASDVVTKLKDLGVASIKIEGRLKGPEYVAATTRLYRAALAEENDAVAMWRDAAGQAFSRGAGPGFLTGVDHQRLVEGRACDHRGLLVGRLARIERVRGRDHLRMRLSRSISRGDGLLVEGARATKGEVGGRVWTILRNGQDVPRAEVDDEVLVWFGPDTQVGQAEPGRDVWRTNDPAREKATLAEVERAPKRTRIHVRVQGQVGEMPMFHARTDAGSACSVAGDAAIAEAAKGAPIRDVLLDKLGRLGDTPFELGEVEVDLPAGAMIAPSSLNRARRAITAALLANASRSFVTTNVSWPELVERAAPPNQPPPAAGLFVLCRTQEQAEAAANAGADGVYLDFLELVGTGAAIRALRTAFPNLTLGVAPPRIRKPGEEKIDRYLASLEPDIVLVRGLGALRDGGSSKAGRIADFSLNVTNRLSAAEVLSRGVQAFTPSFDLDAAQLERLLDSPFGVFAEVVVHHPMPLFHMEHCVIAALLSAGKDYRDCGRPCEKHKISLKDRAGMIHPVEADVGCRNTVFHAAAQSAASVLKTALRCGVRRYRIELVRETAKDVEKIVSTYRRLWAGEIDVIDVYRALRTEGGYGVVKGSLRVLQA